MNIWLDSLALPKKGNTVDEVEDAFCPKNEGVITEDAFIALADGSTDGTFSKNWAECLVQSYCKNRKDDFAYFLADAMSEWNIWKNDFISGRNNENRPLLWYEETGLLRGSFSTFLGLHIAPSDNEDHGNWNALAIGDTCLFQIRDKQLICKFPISISAEFNNHPQLISSNHELNNGLKDVTKMADGQWQINDDFYLMTDALSKWFLTNFENKEYPWETLKTLYNSENDSHPSFEFFPQWVENLRNLSFLKNDDITLIRINVI